MKQGGKMCDKPKRTIPYDTMVRLSTTEKLSGVTLAELIWMVHYLERRVKMLEKKYRCPKCGSCDWSAKGGGILCNNLECNYHGVYEEFTPQKGM